MEKNVSVMGRGKLNLMSKNIESSALYVPSFPFKLLSIGQLTSILKCTATFSPTNVVFQDCITKKMIGEGFFLNGLYYFCKKSHLPKALQENSSKPQDQQLWHQRLAHPSEVVLSKLFPMFCHPSFKCDTCHFSKFARLPFGSSMSKSSTPFEMVHTDVWGPTFESIEGYKYFVIFVDDYT